MRTLRVFVTMVRLRYKARMVYPVAYFGYLLAKLTGYVSEYAILLLLLARFKTIAGWTLPEIFVLHSINMISYTLGASFFYHVAYNFERYSVNGELDGVLLKPMHPLVWLSGFFYSPTYISQTVLGFGVLFWASGQLGLVWNLSTVVLLLGAIVGASFLQASLFLFSCDVCFWTVRGRSVVGTFWSLADLVAYPISIYGPAVRFLLTFIVPVAFINYYPAGLLLDRPEYHELAGLVAISPFVGLALFGLALFVWQRGLRVYSGAGS